MGKAKQIKIKIIPSKIANNFVKKHHYSHKNVQNSCLHMGAFLEGKLHGVMSFGSPLDKRKVLPLVKTKENKPVLWNEMLELNRMAFDEFLPKNSESRCISIAVRLLKKNAPHIKWILSFSDATQCGDGTIYRASGFKLTNIKKNNSLLRLPNGSIVSVVTILAHWNCESMRKICFSLGLENKIRTVSDWKKMGAIELEGYQLRYIYIIDSSCKLNCPDIPFSKIDEIGAGMYKGVKISTKERNKRS